MRKGMRSSLRLLLAVLCCAAVCRGGIWGDTARGDASKRVTLDVEVVWTIPASPQAPVPDPTSGIELELDDGRVVDAVVIAENDDVPDGAAAPKRYNDCLWMLGNNAKGRVRVRIEANPEAILTFRGAGQTARIPLPAVLEGRQRTPENAAFIVSVERLAWDPIALRLKGDGVFAPGGTIEANVAANILTPEQVDIEIRLTADLRPVQGGDAVWSGDHRIDGVVSNRREPPAFAWNIPTPREEGTYVLETRLVWEPVETRANGGRIARWLRRRRGAGRGTTVTRRVTLAVITPEGAKHTRAAAPSTPAKFAPEREVDLVDLARPRGRRLVAIGRAPTNALEAGWRIPEAALVEPARRDGLRGWIPRPAGEATILGPANVDGCSWAAVALKAGHLGRPHRLTLNVLDGPVEALGVAVVDVAGPQPRLLLDTRASKILENDGKSRARSSWITWVDTPEPILIVLNHGSKPISLGAATLSEMNEMPPESGIDLPPAELARDLALDATAAGILERFAAQRDVVNVAERLARYLAYCGANAVVLPEIPRERERRQVLEEQAFEDPIGPDRIPTLVRLLGRHGVNVWIQPDLRGVLPGLPAPDSIDALTRGLVRVDRRGLPDAPVYNPLHPQVHDALVQRITEATAGRLKNAPNAAGFYIPLGDGPTLLGSPNTGLDDPGFERFVKETFEFPPAGIDPNSTDRFDLRAKFVAGPGAVPWQQWRAQGLAKLHADLAAAARAAAGRDVGFAVVTPGLDDGPVGREARSNNLAGLDPVLAWKAVGLDLGVWSREADGPIVLRGLEPGGDPLAHDLDASPELDAVVAERPRRGLALTARDENRSSRRPATPSDVATLTLKATSIDGFESFDEPLGRAATTLDAHIVVLDPQTLAGREDRFRRFARVFRALPATPPDAPPRLERAPFGIALRAGSDGTRTVLAFTNDTPYPTRVETSLLNADAADVDDLGRSIRLAPSLLPGGNGRRLVLDLEPFGTAGIRIAAPRVELGPLTPYPSEKALEDLKTRYQALTEQLARLGEHPTALGGPRPVDPSANSNAGPLGDSESKTAQRALLAALQAYRESRYADFNRLAASHWARRATPNSVDNLLRTGDASALPSARRLR